MSCYVMLCSALHSTLLYCIILCYAILCYTAGSREQDLVAAGLMSGVEDTADDELLANAESSARRAG